MSEEISVYKIARSGIEELKFDLSSLDAITTTLPSGLYTTFRTYAARTKVIGLRAHLDRLYLPAKLRGIVPVMRKPTEFRAVLSDLLVRMDASEARVRLILDTSAEPGTIYALLQPL